MSIPTGRVVLSIKGGTTPYPRPGAMSAEPIGLEVQRLDDEQHHWAVTITPRIIDDRWTQSMVRVEGFVDFEGKRCNCVATYTVEELEAYAGVLIIYTH